MKTPGLKIKGLEEMVRKIKALPGNAVELVDAELGEAADLMRSRAVNDVPINGGGIHQAITSSKLGVMHYEVAANKSYAPYVEWGTYSSVKVPAELQEYAIQFKRSNGEAEGMHARPFFFKNFYLAEAELKKSLRDLIKRSMK